MFYFQDLETQNITLYNNETLIDAVVAHLENKITLINNLNLITKDSEDGYYGIYDQKFENILNVYKKSQVLGVLWNSYQLVHLGNCGEAKLSKNSEKSIEMYNQNHWLYVDQLKELLDTNSYLQIKPSEVMNSK